MREGRYRIVVTGELGARYARAFEGMEVVAEHGETEITSQVADQTHLLGLLERIAGLGLTIRSVTPVEGDP